MSAASRIFRPLAGMFGVAPLVESVQLGTGGISIANSATTSVQIPIPFRKCQLIGLAINATTAAASAGTVTVQVFKRDNSGTPADRTLCAATSIKSDVITTLDKNYSVTITGTDPQTTFQKGDTCRIDVVASGTVSTQPQVEVVGLFALLQ